jgi:type VI secretion system Hcp family effector
MVIKKKIFLLFAGLLFVTPFYAAHAALDMFLKMDELGFKRIPVQSYSLGVDRAAGMTVGSRLLSGKTNPQPLTLVKPLDGASTKLFQYACSGKLLRQVSLEVFNPQTKKKIMTITLENVVISSVAGSGSRQDNRPIETVVLSYGKITQEYELYKPDGSKAGVAKMSFNIETNRLE